MCPHPAGNGFWRQYAQATVDVYKRQFVTGSFTVNGTAATPTVTNNTLTYTIPTIASLGTASVQFQVKVVGGTT